MLENQSAHILEESASQIDKIRLNTDSMIGDDA